MPPAGVAVLRVHGVLLHVDLAHGVHRRHVGALGAHQLRHAVEQDVVLVLRVSAHVHLARGPVMVGAVLLAAAIVDRGVERRQQERIAVDDRKLRRHLGVERRLHRRRVEAHRNGSLLDRHDLGDRAELHGRVHRNVGARLNQHILLHEGAEAFDLDLELVGPGQDEVENVLAGLVRLPDGFDARIDVAQRDVGCGDHRAGRVTDDSSYAPAKLLRGSGERKNNGCQRCRQQYADKSVRHVPPTYSPGWLFGRCWVAKSAAETRSGAFVCLKRPTPWTQACF